MHDRRSAREQAGGAGEQVALLGTRHRVDAAERIGDRHYHAAPRIERRGDVEHVAHRVGENAKLGRRDRSQGSGPVRRNEQNSLHSHEPVRLAHEIVGTRRIDGEGAVNSDHGQETAVADRLVREPRGLVHLHDVVRALCLEFYAIASKHQYRIGQEEKIQRAQQVNGLCGGGEGDEQGWGEQVATHAPKVGEGPWVGPFGAWRHGG